MTIPKISDDILSTPLPHKQFYNHEINLHQYNNFRRTVPLGLTVGQLFDLGEDYALNLYVEAYGVPIRPKNGPQWQAKL